MKKLRRTDRELETNEAISLFSNCEYGVLSTVDENGQPYGVPLNFVYKNNSIFFHCARVGHKLENMDRNPRVSFCVVGNTKVLPAEFATEYESAVAFGVASEVRGEIKHSALLWLLEKYSSQFIEEGKSYIEKHNEATTVIKIEIDHISGKARR
jgi:nitroimidazol reductase NimA-like FMN-containing flavoprotein (pyridoxamine 5'-phosphate oxidase superfamily)